MNHEPTNDLRIVETADGSNTIYNPQVGENYHSKHGALQESKHVFVSAGLDYYLHSETGSKETNASILEVGFGTGLNFLLSADFCIDQKVKLDYTGIEAYPLSAEMIGQTGYDQYISSETWQSFLHQYSKSLTGPVAITPTCQLQVAHCKLLDFQSDKLYDVIYFDAFAAIHQPEMWDETAIAHTVQFLKPGGVFVTYAITGNLKRSLKALGCKVEKTPGAPGKREMLRATANFI
ncbi:tRNA U34 5-methylaminomethyl-2-thiouridine-forming methyltransferase MnmC [Mucilaginibacter frigoritolerans]|uniref:tRNA U34 5-methylaminomethyl-2-thiouridine-forming methyltransferase MnmC n=1 Tax=Mucilaginibacter frigoritolerans TaxID=652788 RepID=A0A562TQV7_9SPHI|nr:tRNA (5-methylaminomethyl-2-thiouridine)(34)-methyltransferase MnmD [Mucilaginibacter frigoritolerans]TWI95925.1 tRNA U34 5-methylaminomethyl-2-thiouridine-forming methyltransferase MnmC [Mucilaginibacter frigoritolerans]